MIPSPQLIAQSRQLVRLRALRRDVAARALASARAGLGEAERALAAACERSAEAEATLIAARVAIACSVEMLPARLAYLEAVTTARADATDAATRADAARGEAAGVFRAAAREHERERARHDQLDTRARALRSTRHRLVEERVAEAEAVVRRCR